MRESSLRKPTELKVILRFFPESYESPAGGRSSDSLSGAFGLPILVDSGTKKKTLVLGRSSAGKTSWNYSQELRQCRLSAS